MELVNRFVQNADQRDGRFALEPAQLAELRAIRTNPMAWDALLTCMKQFAECHATATLSAYSLDTWAESKAWLAAIEAFATILDNTGTGVSSGSTLDMGKRPVAI